MFAAGRVGYFLTDPITLDAVPFMRQPAVVDVEIWIKGGLTLSAEEGRLGFDPRGRLHLLGTGDGTRVLIADKGEALYAYLPGRFFMASDWRSQTVTDPVPISQSSGNRIGFFKNAPSSFLFGRSFIRKHVVNLLRA